jgi:tRNA nucleotidyltransferase/poly(A) polymerase
MLNGFLCSVYKFAANSNKNIYIVGGYVRDALCGAPEFASVDIDIVVNSNAIDFIRQYQEHLKFNQRDDFNGEVNVVEIFEQFKTIKISIEIPGCEQKYGVEFASARTETYPHPAAFPVVKLTDDIKLDLPRRDFTVNALLLPLNYNPDADLEPQVIDYVGGLNDFKDKLIRVFHDRSFIDDPTRIYRAARFAAKLDFNIEPHTLKLMQEAAGHRDYNTWLKQRKNRFAIELEHIHNLGKGKSDKALALLSGLTV